MRRKLNTTNGLQNMIVDMAEGNPGGVTVLAKMIKKDQVRGMLSLLSLDDMNMRGGQIWVGFKDHCGEDLNKFVECVNKRDTDMIAVVNEQCPDHVAVTSGASSNHDS